MFKKRIAFGLLGLGAACGAILLAVAAGGVLFGSLGAASIQGRGDLNGDGVVTLADAPPFVVALRDPGAWQRRHRRTWRELLRVADFNADADVSRYDIAGFSDLMRALLGGGGGSQASGGGGGDDGLGFADLDVDSDNNNGTNQPARTAFEDTIEDDPAQTGKFVLVNDDDDDRDGTPDKDQNGTIQAERDDLVPLVLEIVPDASVQPVVTSLDYRLTYPANVRLWRSATRGDLGSDVVVSGVTYQQVVWILGDMNGDGFFNGADIDPFFLALGDPAAFALQYPNVDAAAVGDMNGDGLFNGADIDPFFAALGAGTISYVPVRMWIEGLAPSAAMADTRFVADVDTDNNGSLDATDAVRTTLVAMAFSPTSGVLGTAINLTLQPAVPPVEFTNQTTATWSGVFIGTATGSTSTFQIDYDATTFHESTATMATIVLGEGSVASGDPQSPGLAGVLDGDLTIHFSSFSLTRATVFTLDQSFTYVAGVLGAGDEVTQVPIIDPNNPGWGEALTLEGAVGGHVLLTILAEKNTFSAAAAPTELLVDLVSQDVTGQEIDRQQLSAFLEQQRDDFGPQRLVYYSDWEVPVVFVSSPVDPVKHPTLSPLFVDPAGQVFPVLRTTP